MIIKIYFFFILTYFVFAVFCLLGHNNKIKNIYKKFFSIKSILILLLCGFFSLLFKLLFNLSLIPMTIFIVIFRYYLKLILNIIIKTKNWD